MNNVTNMKAKRGRGRQPHTPRSGASTEYPAMQNQKHTVLYVHFPMMRYINTEMRTHTHARAHINTCTSVVVRTLTDKNAFCSPVPLMVTTTNCLTINLILT